MDKILSILAIRRTQIQRKKRLIIKLGNSKKNFTTRVKKMTMDEKIYAIYITDKGLISPNT